MLQEILSLKNPHVLKSHAYVTWAVPCAPAMPAGPHQSASSSSGGSIVSNKDSACHLRMAPSCFPPKGLTPGTAAEAPAGDASMQQQQQQQQLVPS
jgi:hypothetical protein